MVNIHSGNGVRREYPNWNQTGRIKRIDESGNVLEGQYAFNGEVVRISPRYQTHGRHFRVRPERPAVFFAAFLKEKELLPTLLTPEECQEEWALALMDPMWTACSAQFYKLESPFAACDAATVPNHRVGFSFNILQVLVEPMGTVRTANGRPTVHLPGSVPTNAAALEAARQRIAEMRARAGAPQSTATKSKKS